MKNFFVKVKRKKHCYSLKINTDPNKKRSGFGDSLSKEYVLEIVGKAMEAFNYSLDLGVEESEKSYTIEILDTCAETRKKDDLIPLLKSISWALQSHNFKVGKIK